MELPHNQELQRMVWDCSDDQRQSDQEGEKQNDRSNRNRPADRMRQARVIGRWRVAKQRQLVLDQNRKV